MGGDRHRRRVRRRPRRRPGRGRRTATPATPRRTHRRRRRRRSPTTARDGTGAPPPTVPASTALDTCRGHGAGDVAPPTTDASDRSTAGAQYETIAAVLDTTEHVPALCLGQWIVGGGMPTTCVGPVLAGWSWDLVDGEQSTAYATWAEAYVAGTWDPATQVFTVSEARTPTAADRARFAASTPHARLLGAMPRARRWLAGPQPGMAGRADPHDPRLRRLVGGPDASGGDREVHGRPGSGRGGGAPVLRRRPVRRAGAAQQGRVDRDREPTDVE